MICPKCGMYNAYGKQECTGCGHSFVPKPIDLSDDEAAAAQERENQPYYYTASAEFVEEKRKLSLPPAVVEALEKVRSVLVNIWIFLAFAWKSLRKHKTLCRILFAITAIFILFGAIKIVGGVKGCIDEQARLRALAASLADVVEVDPTPSVASMSDVWVLNQYDTKLVLKSDGSFTNEDFAKDESSVNSGTWTHDIDRIYLVYGDGTLKNHTYKLIGDYLFLDWEEKVLNRDCNESESVAAAGLWINGDGYAMALNEDGTHGAGSEEYGKYANTWVMEGSILATITLIDNVEYFNYYNCEISGSTMVRTEGTVYVREGGGIALGSGEIAYSVGYSTE